MLLLALILTAVGYGLFLFLIPESYFAFFPVVPFFIFAVTATVHFYLVRASNNDARKFTSRYLGAMGVKLFAYIVFLIIFLALVPQHAIPFLISFLVSYAVFTTIEVISILKFLKQPK